MKTALFIVSLAGYLAVALPLQATVNADFASNYSGGWTNGANGGAGFGAWSIEATAGSGLATNGIWNSANAGLEMGNAFGLGAWGDGASIRVARAFAQALTNGNVFAFDLGLNYDAGSGRKGFVLRTADDRAIVTVNQSSSEIITINDTAALTNYGITTMHWTITQTSSTQVKLYATGRSGSEAITIIVTNATASYLAGIQFYATNLTADADADLRGVYFDNLVLSQASGTNAYSYSVDSSLTTITGVATNVTGDVVVPSTLGGYPVVAIGRAAFKDCTNITSITFASGETVTNLGVAAFQGCTRLALAVLPAALTAIPDGLFNGCSSLVSVTIPTSVTNIGNLAFAGCRSLPSVALPSGLKVMGESAFLNCRSLSAIDLPANPKSIPDQSYYECRSLAAVDLPASVTNIGYSAFYNCVGLTSLAAPSTLATLAADAFNGCSGLTTLMFSGALASIGDRAFYGCSGLEKICFHAGVSILGATVFGNNPQLASVYFAGSQPTVANSGTDLFEASARASIYALSLTGWSSVLGGMPVAQWLPVIGVPTKGPGALGFNVDWANGRTVRVQTCTNLAEPAWTDWSTNTVSNGSCAFIDTDYDTFQQRCYRVLGQP